MINVNFALGGTDAYAPIPTIDLPQEYDEQILSVNQITPSYSSCEKPTGCHI